MPSSEALAAAARHLRLHAVRTDGPFTLRSGRVSSWYLDARQTTFSGEGARLVGAAVWEVIEADGVDAVGGMTMGADPIAVAAAVHAAGRGRPLRAFSVRKQAKDHGTGGRLAGPVGSGDRVAIVEDTATTGGSLIEALEAAEAEGLEVVRAVVLVDRSGGEAGRRAAERGVPYTALLLPADLGVDEAPEEAAAPPADGGPAPEETGMQQEEGVLVAATAGPAADAPPEGGGPAPAEDIPGVDEDTPDAPIYEGGAVGAAELAVHRRFPRRWYLLLAGIVMILHGGGVLFGWRPTPDLRALVFPPVGSGVVRDDDDISWVRQVIDWIQRLWEWIRQLWGGEPGVVRDDIASYETRDLTWAWLFLIVGVILILWIGGRITARLTERRPAVQAGPDGLRLSLRGPWRHPAAVPWSAVGGISAETAADSYGEYPALRIEAVDPSALPARPWGARWTDDGALSINARSWEISPEDAAERLAEIRDAAEPPQPSPTAPAGPPPGGDPIPTDPRDPPPPTDDAGAAAEHTTDEPPAAPGAPPPVDDPPDSPAGEESERTEDAAPAASDKTPGSEDGPKASAE